MIIFFQKKKNLKAEFTPNELHTMVHEAGTFGLLKKIEIISEEYPYVNFLPIHLIYSQRRSTPDELYYLAELIKKRINFESLMYSFLFSLNSLK